MLVPVTCRVTFYYPDSFASEESRLGCFSFLPATEKGRSLTKRTKICQPWHVLGSDCSPAASRGFFCL